MATVTWQAFAELAKTAPDGHTRWHSMTDREPTADAAFAKAKAYLAQRLLYDHSNVKQLVRIGLVEHPTMWSVVSVTLDELPSGTEVRHVLVGHEDDVL